MKTTIFKYLDEKGSLETIKNNSVILKTPSEYNDPFDCVISVGECERKKAFKLFLNYQLFKGLFDTLVTNKDKVIHLKKLAKVYEKNLQLTAKDIRQNKAYSLQLYLLPFHPLAYKYIGKSKVELLGEFDAMLKNAFEAMRKEALVSCFGSLNNSILMWSHYADKHKGACLEFEIEDKDFKEVTYSKTMPNFMLCRILEPIFGHLFLNEEMDDSDEKYDFIDEPLLTKSIDWQYEGEVRCVYSSKKRDPKIYDSFDENGNTIVLLKMPRIKRIYLGCNADDDFVRDIKELSGNIPVVKMKMKENEYGIEPE